MYHPSTWVTGRKTIIVMGMEKHKKRYVQTGYGFVDPVWGLNSTVFSSMPVCAGASLNSALLPQALSKEEPCGNKYNVLYAYMNCFISRA